MQSPAPPPLSNDQNLIRHPTPCTQRSFILIAYPSSTRTLISLSFKQRIITAKEVCDGRLEGSYFLQKPLGKLVGGTGRVSGAGVGGGLSSPSSHQFFLSQGRTCADIRFLSIMMMASAQLRVFSSNNIEICIINPRIPVVETGAVTPPHFPLPPLPPLLSLFHSHPPSPPQFDVIKQERTERKGERFISY